MKGRKKKGREGTLSKSTKASGFTANLLFINFQRFFYLSWQPPTRLFAFAIGES